MTLTASTPGLVERIMSEQPIGLAEAVRCFGEISAGGKVHPSTVARWITKGVRFGGRFVRLEGIRVGERLVTSKPALVRFLKAQNPEAGPATDPHRTASERRHDHKRAERELESMGVK